MAEEVIIDRGVAVQLPQVLALALEQLQHHLPGLRMARNMVAGGRLAFPLCRQPPQARVCGQVATNLHPRGITELDDARGTEQSIGVGVGIDTGISRMGEVGNAFKDFTAIRPVVDLSSRLQTAAQAGEILITSQDYDKVKDEWPDLPGRSLSLKGIGGSVESNVIGVDVYRAPL